MIPEIGHFALILALLLTLVQGVLPIAAGRAMAIHTRSPRAAPAMGSTPWTRVSRSARISAK